MSWYRNLVWFTDGMRHYTKGGFEAAARGFDQHELDGVSLANRRVIVTGANSGIGLVCCNALAKRGAEVHLICRNAARGQAAKDEVTQAGKDANSSVHLHQLDMSQPKKVSEFARQFIATHGSLDILINNAGCMVNDLQYNEDKLELNFATNSLGTYILTEGLVPALQKSTDPRVIVVSSGGMLVQKLNHSDPMLLRNHHSFDGTMVYAQNKRQQVVMVEMWASAYPAIHFSSMHPGWADTPAVANSMPSFHQRMEGRLRTPEQGADTAIWLALTPNIKSFPSGSFFQDRKAVGKHLRLAHTHSSLLQKQELMIRLKEIAQPFV